ncbi:hypothetical protein EPUL_006662, partial [Erysiphe pulchra]
MLLMQQTGSLKIGEIIRYTITYVPSQDPTVHPSSAFYLRIKNGCTAALRAAFIRGPYNLSVAAYPATYNPNEEFKDAKSLGIPTFEPYLRAGGAWDCKLKIPEQLRKNTGSRKGSLSIRNGDRNEAEQVSWIVEISSQVVLSGSALVHYEVLLGSDQNCLSPDASVMHRNPSVRRHSFQDRIRSTHSRTNSYKLDTQSKGVFSKAIELKVEDTAILWSKPCLPENFRDDEYLKEAIGSETDNVDSNPKEERDKTQKKERLKKFHLVILTHGLHSNIGADMLYLKESIDAAVKQAKVNAGERRRERKERNTGKSEKNQINETSKVTQQVPQDQINESEEEEEEDVVVRGFSGNVARTERGIKYLGKRLARYVLSMTHPEQPFQKVPKRRLSQAISHKRSQSTRNTTNEHQEKRRRAYQFTSISFIGHSLGGIVQTYAVAYIQKHWPNFFDQIKPINFIALATPFLGLSNENPSYVKFALDFGFIGRTGQDLGLTWSAPTIARSGLGAIFGLLSENSPDQNQSEDKPILQILPMGPAHSALKKFKNRTVYSNVVNDGIVPLRTSCLFFIDWQCLGKVEKAKRECGLMGKFAEWSWAEITGATSNTISSSISVSSDDFQNEDYEKIPKCPSPRTKFTHDDNNEVQESSTLSTFIKRIHSHKSTSNDSLCPPELKQSAFIKRIHTPKSPTHDSLCPPELKETRIYQRSQTIKSPNYARSFNPPSPLSSGILVTLTDSQPMVTPTRTSVFESNGDLLIPPRTSVFESAGDLLIPPLPSVEYLLNFSSRPQSIFHDRIYHPWDIPPPVQEKKLHKSLSLQAFRKSSDNISGSRIQRLSSRVNIEKNKLEAPGNFSNAGMKIEEKIARAYHRDISWRKVLVRLEPDAHNNIIVRRMFANAYGWPVVKHLCDTHFSESEIHNSHDRTWPLVEEISKNGTENFVYEIKQNKHEFYEDSSYNDSDTESEDDNELRPNFQAEPKI